MGSYHISPTQWKMFPEILKLFFSDQFCGQGNSFHGTGGRGNKKAQMRHCLRLMRSVVSTEDEVVLQDLADQGAINQLIGQCEICLYTDLQFKENCVSKYNVHYDINNKMNSFMSFFY